MSGGERIVAVVVTWNRKELLRRNLRAVLGQTRPVDEILVVDNASTDGTPEMLAAEFPMVRLLRLAGNAGAAGGMHVGVREGLALGADWLWLMDDDGVPSPGCLAEQMRVAKREGYALCGPLLLSIDAPSTLAFPPPRPNLPGSVNALRRQLGRDHLDILNLGLWNGTLVSATAAATAGLPKYEMFIWGEEREFTYRIAQHGYRTGLAINATYFHPPSRMQVFWLLNVAAGPIRLLRCAFLDPRSPRALLHARNLGFTDWRYHGIVRVAARFAGGLLVWAKCRGIAGARDFARYYLDGVRDRFSLEPSRDVLLARLATLPSG